ncbi:unnamed protein product, partial [Phaeothamnion confervicola]
IKHIRLIGERHSGSTFLYQYLQRHFSGSGISVESRLCNFKHWFQDDIHDADAKDTMIVAIFRNPYDWVASMFKTPHHSISHVGITFPEFLNRTWTLHPTVSERVRSWHHDTAIP